MHLKVAAAEAAWLEEEDDEESDEEYDGGLDEELDDGSDEELFEAPVPSNLSVLTHPLSSLIEFYELDQDLVAAAVQDSPRQEASAPDLAAHIDKLPAEEQRALLVRLLNGEQHLDLELRRRLLELAPPASGTESSISRRSIKALMAMADEMKRERKAKQREAREAAQRKRLEKIAAQKDALWMQVMNLIAEKKIKAYDQAVEILKDLRDLAVYQQQEADFYEKTADIITQYPKLSGLHDRMRRAQLLK
ncbi:MAG: hypothetical protein IH587_01835 [Anaerolineae bacterium]|nr:hypothetical protein [Anaerolineae bacterium]